MAVAGPLVRPLLRRLLCVVPLALIVAGSVEPYYFQVFTFDRAALRSTFTELPYRKMPGLRMFLLEIRARTKHGDRIAVTGPFRTWDGGYDYYYGRCLYTLAGRQVLPLLDPGNRSLAENIGRAEYLAVFRANARVPGFETAWSGPQGVLLRRIR